MMTIKYHDPNEHPRCETCMLAHPDGETTYFICHLSCERGELDTRRAMDWLCEKGLWWVKTEPPQKPELPVSEDVTWEYMEVRYEHNEPPLGFEAMLRLHEAATREGK